MRVTAILRIRRGAGAFRAALLLCAGAAPVTAQLPDPAAAVVGEQCEALGGCEDCHDARARCDSDRATCDAEHAACLACGNGTRDPGEECDAGDLGEATCETLTGGEAPYGGLRCGERCTIETDGCLPRLVARDLTVVDHETGLEWEMKNSLDGVEDFTNPNDADNRESWATCRFCAAVPDGTVFTRFLASLNACRSTDGRGTDGGFAGHCDWRLPRIDELLTIRDCSHGAPCIHPIFGPTASTLYWSGTRYPSGWQFFTGNFEEDGNVVTLGQGERSFFRVRAVRRHSEPTP